MGVLIKICGLASEHDVRAVADMRPDALGFVLWKRSPRGVTADDVAQWTRDLPEGILKVGVFVDASENEMRSAVETAGLDVIQLHGFPGGAGDFQGLEKRGEKFPRIGKTRLKISKVWKVVRLTESVTPPPPAVGVDAYLLDSYSAESPGGTGRVVDWGRARAFVRESPIPVVLAGGLTPENVEKALEIVGPWGVDVSSGVEVRPGVKDLARVKDFINRCRAR